MPMFLVKFMAHGARRPGAMHALFPAPNVLRAESVSQAATPARL
jgi:hypothetical protein